MGLDCTLAEGTSLAHGDAVLHSITSSCVVMPIELHGHSREIACSDWSARAPMTPRLPCSDHGIPRSRSVTRTPHLFRLYSHSDRSSRSYSSECTAAQSDRRSSPVP